MIQIESLGLELPWWLFIFIILGVGTGGLFAAVAINGLVDWIKGQIERLRYRYIYRHRFDKPPLAKCYCLDCQGWHQNKDAPDEGKCWEHAGWVTADCWFCWEAEPRETDRE